MNLRFCRRYEPCFLVCFLKDRPGRMWAWLWVYLLPCQALGLTPRRRHCTATAREGPIPHPRAVCLSDKFSPPEVPYTPHACHSDPRTPSENGAGSVWGVHLPASPFALADRHPRPGTSTTQGAVHCACHGTCLVQCLSARGHWSLLFWIQRGRRWPFPPFPPVCPPYLLFEGVPSRADPQQLSFRGRTVRCAKSRLLSTAGSHGPQGPELRTPEAVWIGSHTPL